MSSSPANVRSLSTVNRQIPEVKSLMDAVAKLSWDLRVPLISQTLGLGYSIDSKLLSKDLPLPRASVGRKMGFSTLGEVISSPASDGGLELDWETWQNDIKAYNYKKVFGIYYKSQDEVLKEYTSICDAIGHAPLTLHEFTKARDDILIRNHQRKERELAEKAEEYKRSCEVALGERDSIESSYVRISEDLKRLREQHSALESEYHSEIELLQSATELRVREAEDSLRDQLSADYDIRLSKLRREIKGLEDELRAALEKVAAMESSSDQMGEIVRNLRVKISDKDNELRIAEEKIAHQDEVISRYERSIDSLEMRIQEITTETGIAEMEQALALNRDRLVKLSSNFKLLKESRADLHARLDKSRQRVSMLRADLRDRKAEIKNQAMEVKKKELEVASYKKARNVLVVVTLSSLALLLGVSSLIA